MCCDSWGRKELDMTELLNLTELNSWQLCSFKSEKRDGKILGFCYILKTW